MLKTIKKLSINHLTDILLIVGCVCILFGLAQWNTVLTWIMAGLMLVGFSLMIGKARANNVDREATQHQSENK